MKMKKILALMLAAVMALSLVSCGGNDTPNNDVGSSSSANGSGSNNTEPAQGSQEDPGPEQEPKSKATSVPAGETVALAGVDVELATGEFVFDDKLGGTISVSSHSDSNKYFWLSGTMTNTGTETISSFSIEAMVNIVFDDAYNYEGSFMLKDDIGPFAESEVFFWADVPPAMLERYKTVKVQFAYNNGFEDFNWEANNYEKTAEGFDNLYEFTSGSGGDSGASAASATGSDTSAKAIAIGETITTNDYEFTLTNVELTYEVLPPNTNSVYTSYAAESGKVYVHVAADVKNTMQRDIRIDELFKSSALYDGKYSYNGFTVVNDGDNRFDWVGSYVAATPLETCKAHGLIECPDEVDTSGKSVVVTLVLGNDTYEYTLR